MVFMNRFRKLIARQKSFFRPQGTVHHMNFDFEVFGDLSMLKQLSHLEAEHGNPKKMIGNSNKTRNALWVTQYVSKETGPDISGGLRKSFGNREKKGKRLRKFFEFFSKTSRLSGQV